MHKNQVALLEIKLFTVISHSIDLFELLGPFLVTTLRRGRARNQEGGSAQWLIHLNLRDLLVLRKPFICFDKILTLQDTSLTDYHNLAH